MIGESSADGFRHRVMQNGIGSVGEVPHGSTGSNDELRHSNEELDVPEETEEEVEETSLDALIPVDRSEWRIRVHYDFAGGEDVQGNHNPEREERCDEHEHQHRNQESFPDLFFVIVAKESVLISIQDIFGDEKIDKNQSLKRKVCFGLFTSLVKSEAAFIMATALRILLKRQMNRSREIPAVTRRK